MDTRCKCTRHSTIAAAVALCLCATGAAVAQPLHPAPPGSILMTDQQLSELRGRYVDPGRILYFGIEMNTQWRTSVGSVTTSEINFSMNRTGGAYVPTVTVVTNTSVNNASSAPAAYASSGQTSISGNAFNDVKGVTQVTQVSGNGNGGHNVIDLNLHNVGNSANGIATNGISGGSSAQGNDGSTATAIIGANQIGVAVNIPGQGRAIQTISGFQGIRQQLQIGGNLNSVVNTLSLNAGFAGNAGSSTPAGITTSLNQLKGLTQIGRY